MHVITGLPRSGSTLLCNILSQNPEVYASSTSGLCETTVAACQFLTTRPEVSAALEGDREVVARTVRAMAEARHSAAAGDAVVFDKDRSWAVHTPLLRRLWPDSVVVCMVRDPRQVFASIEERHVQTAELMPGPYGGMAQRAAVMMQVDGLIGSCIVAVEDLLRRDPDNCLVVEYDEFVANPKKVMGRIYTAVGKKAYKHNFAKVVSVAQDLDVLYHYKFPHDGSGKVEARAPRKLPTDVANHIAKQYPFYMERLRYAS